MGISGQCVANSEKHTCITQIRFQPTHPPKLPERLRSVSTDPSRHHSLYSGIYYINTRSTGNTQANENLQGRSVNGQDEFSAPSTGRIYTYLFICFVKFCRIATRSPSMYMYLNTLGAHYAIGIDSGCTWKLHSSRSFLFRMYLLCRVQCGTHIPGPGPV